MTRRWRVMRIPRAATACCSLPVVSAVLRRSPVEARWAGDVAIRSSPLARTTALGVARQPAHNVIVHNVSEQHQEEHKSNLHETLFERQAEIAATDAFQSQQQDIAAVQDGNRQQVQNTQVHTDEHHERNYRQRPLPNRFAGGTRYADGTLELLHGYAAAEELPDDPNRLLDALASHRSCITGAICEGHSPVRSRVTYNNSNLINRFSRFSDALLRYNFCVDDLTLAFEFEFDGLTVRAPDALHELSPIFDPLPIHGADDVALFQPRALRRSSRGHFVEDGRERCIAKNALQGHAVRDRDFNAALDSVVFHFHFQPAAGRRLFHGFLHLLPGWIRNTVDRQKFVSRLQGVRRSRRVRRHGNHLNGQIKKSGIGQTNGDKQPRQQKDRENQIHGRSSKRNQRTLPAWLAH